MSNRTPKSNDDAIASAPKTSKPASKLIKCIIIVGVVLTVVVIAFLMLSNRQNSVGSQNCVRYEATNNKVGNCLLSLEFARSPEEQSQGLSGRPSLPEDKGLMFVFVQPGKQCFWMKDMQFPIDIIWLNTQKEIQHIEENVSPNTFPRTFCPEVEAQYVLEVSAGMAGKLNMRANQKLLF